MERDVTTEPRKPLPPVDVAIVGYGPVGATLANFLGAAGLSVLVVDREPDILDIPRGVHVDGEVMRIFQSLGLAEACNAHVKPAYSVQYRNGEGRLLLERRPSSMLGEHGWTDRNMVHQPDMEAILRQGVDRYPNVRVLLSHEVEEVRDEGAAATLRLRNLATAEVTTWRAGWVIGCDGARSQMRQVIGTGLEDLGLHQPWLVVDVCLTKDLDLPDATVHFCDPSRPATFLNVTGQRRRWEMMLMPGDDAETITRPGAVWSLLARWGVTPQNAVLERARVYTFHSLIADRWRNGRLFLAGDSAHQTPPFLGQGLCAGLRDTANLAWKLALVLRGAPHALLDSYQSERRAHVSTFIKTSVRLGGIIQTTDPIAAAERDAAFLRSGPEELPAMSPPLGPGLHTGGTVGGHILPQPRLSDGARLDDAIGDGFAVILRPGMLGDVPAALRQRFDRLGTAWIDDPALQPWLEQAGARIVVLRPDRYALGSAEDIAGLERLADLLPVLAGHSDRTLDLAARP